MSQHADRWVASLAAVRWEDLSAREQTATTRLVFDALGIATAGLAAPGVSALTALHGPGASTGPVPVPFTGWSLSATDAAFVLSAMVHSWDFDDTHDTAVVHTAAVALPAAIAGATTGGGSGADLLAGVVAGVQALSRLGLAVGLRPGVIRTAGLGAIAAAVAASRAAGADAASTAAAVRLAAAWSLAPGSRQPVVDGSLSKRIQPAMATEIGVRSAALARAGMDGPAGWLDGTFGLLTGAGAEELVAGLFQPGWEVAEVALKPYPACRYAHGAVAAAEAAYAAHGGPVAGEVEVHLPVGAGFALVARRFEPRGEPIIDAQFSAPWLVAAALQAGTVGLDAMVEPRVTDPDLAAFASSIEVAQDLEPGADGMGPAVVVVGGERFEATTVPGSPAEPITADAHRRKVEGCLAVAGLDRGVVDQIERFVTEAPAVDAGALTSSLRDLAALLPKGS